MPCKVCGNAKTVKSHLLPKSIIIGLHGESRRAFSGARDRLGTQSTQGGEFDSNILCLEHEGMLSDCDNYGVKFFKAFDRSARGPKGFEDVIYVVPNPKPSLLLKFVLSVVWRHALSGRYGQPNPLNLGPWEPELRNKIFFGTSYDPDFCIAQQDFIIGESRHSEIVMPPYHNYNFGRRGFEFYVMGFRLTVKLDGQSKGRMPKLLRANGQNPVLVFRPDAITVTDEPDIMVILKNMRSKVQLGEVLIT